MSPTYRIEWLQTALAKRVFPLASKTSRHRRQQLTTVQLQEFLTRADRAGTNLSAVLLRRNQAVAFVLATVDLEAGSQTQCIRVANLGFMNGRTPAFKLLLRRWATMIRARQDLRALPVLIECPTDEISKRSRYKRFYEYLGYRCVTAPATADRWTWLVLEPHLQPASQDTAQLEQSLKNVQIFQTPTGPLYVGLIDTWDLWTTLEPCWDDLLKASPGATVFQSYDYLRTWWKHFGWGEELWILVALRDRKPVAIAPMSISVRRWLGIQFRQLGYLGIAPESDRPTTLIAASENEAIDHIAGFIVSRKSDWDELFLAEQPQDSRLPAALKQRLTADSYLLAKGTTAECPITELQGSWDQLLSSKPKSVRKSFKRKVSKLQEAGDCRLETCESEAGAMASLDRYLGIERSSWKADTKVGVNQSAVHRAFYGELVRTLSKTGGVEFRFLALDNATIAATFGLAWQRCFYSLHIAHDAKYDDFSPGVVLTYLELEASFKHRRHDVFDFLTGVLPNKGSWATTRLALTNFHAYRTTLKGCTYYWVQYRIRPAVRAALIRTRLLATALKAKKWLLQRLGKDPDA